MSTKSQVPLSPNEFEDLKLQIINVRLSDAQITDIALILRDKWEKNGS